MQYFLLVKSYMYFGVLISALLFNGLSMGSATFLEKFIPKCNHRFETFDFALNLMEERGVKILVETGTARLGEKNCNGDGCSTFVFSQWAAQNGAFLYSVDIDKASLHYAANDLMLLNRFVQLVHGDSVEFLKTFNKPIDFLYLDSYDFAIDNPGPSQEHHLNEIVAAYPWLTKNSIVMIDDCDLPYGGKGKLVIDYLLSKNWKIATRGYQVVLIHDD